MAFKVPEKDRVKIGAMATDETLGNNGAFCLMIKGIITFCVASDGGDWEHVSVSLPGRDRTPTWEHMCLVKEVFWRPEDCVIQFHPAARDYVNYHPFCLHLWRPSKELFPTPPAIFVGPKP